MKKYYPIEVLHWSGMNDDCLDDLKSILMHHPEYINVMNPYHDNCLMIASKMGNIKMVEFLVKSTEIDINHSNNDGNALNIAVSNNQTDIVKFLIENTFISTKQKNVQGKSIYHLAAQKGNADLVEFFLEKQLDITILDNKNRHCLFDLIESYVAHKNYWCFELIQENLPQNIFMTKGSDGKDILQYTEEIKASKKIGKELFDPLRLIIKSRL